MRGVGSEFGADTFFHLEKIPQTRSLGSSISPRKLDFFGDPPDTQLVDRPGAEVGQCGHVAECK